MKIKGKEGLVKRAFVKPTDGFCFQPKQVTLNILIEQVSSFTLDVKKKRKKRSSSLLIDGFIQKDSETLHRKTFCTYVHVDDCSVNSVHLCFSY